MPSIIKQKATEKRPRQSDVLLSFQNVDVILENSGRFSKKIHYLEKLKQTHCLVYRTQARRRSKREEFKSIMNSNGMKIATLEEETSRERPESAPYLRLKNRKKNVL